MRRAGRCISRAGARLVLCVMIAGGLVLLVLVGFGLIMGYVVDELDGHR